MWLLAELMSRESIWWCSSARREMPRGTCIDRDERAGPVGTGPRWSCMTIEKSATSGRSSEKRVSSFQRLGPPSAGRVLEAASLDAARALTRVQDDVVPHFLETAKQLCADELAETSDEAASLVARCLAAVARQNELRARSVLTGEADRTTLLHVRPSAAQDVGRRLRRLQTPRESTQTGRRDAERQ